MISDLIVFGEDWGGHPSSTQHIIGHLAATRRVLWVNSIGLRQPRFTLADARRVAGKLKTAFLPPKQPKTAASLHAVAPGFGIVQPLMLPMVRHRVLRALNRYLLAHSVGGAALAAKLHRPVLWTSLPSAVDAIGALGETAVVYYCGDDFGALAGVDHATALAQEHDLAARADLILAASPAIAQRFPAHKTHILPHGVDLDLFSTAAPRAADLPQGDPIAGFYGALAPWIDTDLIAATARALPDWQFVFIGPVQTDITALAACPNISLLGPRPHADLPRYAQHWTASIIPFRDSPQIRACNPLKLREYLAAGRPIVSTDFPALAPYRAGISVACNAADFAVALNACRADTKAAQKARQDLVAGETWAARAALVAHLIAAIAT